jgi:hypothetical protein
MLRAKNGGSIARRVDQKDDGSGKTADKEQATDKKAYHIRDSPIS